MSLDRAFDADTLFSLRKAVLAEAAAAGLPGYRAADAMLAVHELAANAVRHGAGAGRLAMHVLDGRQRRSPSRSWACGLRFPGWRPG